MPQFKFTINTSVSDSYPIINDGGSFQDLATNEIGLGPYEITIT